MEKDKELLLSMQPSDSDDVVEEFKLPPPRTRRPKVRKTLGEARISAQNSTLWSWKCCFLFVITAIFISGALVLAYFMLSMQQQISQLMLQMSKANTVIRRHDATKISVKKLMAKLEENKQKFSKQDLNIKLLVHQINQVNKTMKKMSPSKENEHQLTTLTRDVDSIKIGMASTGGDISKIQAEILQHSDKFDSILTELKNVKVNIFKATAKNKSVLSTIQPFSAQTQTIQDIQIRIDSLNTTLIQGLSKLSASSPNYKNKNEHMASLDKRVTVFMNLSQELQKEVDHHHRLLDNYVDLENDVKNCNDLINSTQQDIHRLQTEIGEHHKVMEKTTTLQNDMKNYNSLMNSTKQDIRQLQIKVDKHHKLMAKTAERINNLTFHVASKTDSVVIPTKHETNTSEETMRKPTSKVPEEATGKPKSKTTRKPTTKVPEEATETKSAAPMETTSKPLTMTSNETVKQDETEERKTKWEMAKFKTNISSLLPTTEELTEKCPLPCDPSEKCLKTTEGYKCVCGEGYAKVGKVCEDQNECNGIKKYCHRNATCTNTFGSYKCTCNEGFQGNGTYCKLQKDRCNLPKVTGNCRAALPSFYYDGNSESCETFLYGGCNGNANRFVTEKECKDACVGACHAKLSTVPKGLIGAHIPQCKSDGTYEEKQCHGSTGYCWCVDPKNGTEIKGTKKGPTEGDVTCGSSPLETTASLATNVTNGVLLLLNSTMQLDLSNSTGVVNSTPDAISESVIFENEEQKLDTKLDTADWIQTTEVTYLTPEMPDETGRYPDLDQDATGVANDALAEPSR